MSKQLVDYWVKDNDEASLTLDFPVWNPPVPDGYSLVPSNTCMCPWYQTLKGMWRVDAKRKDHKEGAD